MGSCLSGLTEKNKRMGVSVPHVTALLSSSPNWTFLSYPASTQAPITSPCFLPSDFSTPIQLLLTTAFKVYSPKHKQHHATFKRKAVANLPLGIACREQWILVCLLPGILQPPHSPQKTCTSMPGSKDGAAPQHSHESPYPFVVPQNS